MRSVVVRRDMSVGATTDGVSRREVYVSIVEASVGYGMKATTEEEGCTETFWTGTR